MGKLISLLIFFVMSIMPIAYAQYERQPCIGCIATGSVGAQKTIAVLVEFSDAKHSISRDAIHDRVFNKMDAYYREMSYGQTWLEGNTTQWYTLSNPLSYYSISPYNMKVDRKRVEALVTDAANAADNDVNFSQYSNVVVIVGAVTTAGKGYGMTGYAAIPGMLGTNKTIKTKSGEVIKSAIVAAENAHFGIIAHDYAHALGGAIGNGRPVQDLYDYDLQSTPGEFYGHAQFYHIYLGYWDILSSHLIERDSPPPGMSSSTKIKLGWISPTQVAVVPLGQTATVKLEPLEHKTSRILVIKIPLTNTTYYLLENRQQVGYDSVLPGSGVLILYVNESVSEGNGPVRVVSSKPVSYPKNIAFEHGPGKNVAKEVPYLNDAPLDMENPLFSNSKNNLSIRLLEKIDSSYVVKVAPMAEQAYKGRQPTLTTPMPTPSKGICGPAVIVLLAVLPAGIRRLSASAFRHISDRSCIKN